MVAGLESTVFINEFHYDNVGTDSGEFIEIANTMGTSLDGWSVVLYTGTSGRPYATYALTGSAALSVITLPVRGLENADGKPDGIALVNSSTAVVQFLSYEGSLLAKTGVAAGLTSTDIGVNENKLVTPVGTSLQLSGSGKTYGDFIWAPSASHTSGLANNTQELAVTTTTITGDKGDNELNGQDFSKDTIIGQRGNDVIRGRGADDFILGNRENDTLYGDDGNDTLYGGTENDTLYGGAGNDRLNGDKHDDVLWGEKGADTFVYGKAFGHDLLADFEDGVDHIEFSVKVFKGFDAVKAAMTQDGADVVIKHASGDVLRIANVSVDNLSADDFFFL